VKKEPTILVFDSGLGGLTVFREVAQLRPAARYIYVADDAVFPYGRLEPDDVIARVARVIESMIFAYRPDVIVIACNTASTLVLPDLRAAFPEIPFVGTVPAVKPAAEQSRSHMISVLATPGTVARDYTRDLIRDYAAHCDVTLVGSESLASLAEDFMHGEMVDDIAIAREIAPCFVEKDGRRTDHIVLACTHYPLLRAQFERLAPWKVDWVDPAPAIARRVDHVLREEGFAPDHHGRAQNGVVVFTSGLTPKASLAQFFAQHHLQIEAPPVQLAPFSTQGS
jgi:glutamate racemase